MLVVHPHFHRRRTGVTRHVEEQLRHPAEGVDVRALEFSATGRALASELPRISLGEVLARATSENVIWHAHRNLEAIAGLFVRALRRKVRVLFTRHSDGRPGLLTRWLHKRVDGVIALTPHMASQLSVAAKVVPHGVDVSRFPPPTDRGQEWRALQQGGDRGIGVVGRIRKKKGQGDFVRALSTIDAPGWKAVLIGAARGRDRAWARSLTSERVCLVGEQRDIARWYRGLTVVVQPSHSEGFGLVVLEAMAAGCCVISSRTGGAEALITDGVTGLLYPPGDMAALRACLEKVIASPELARQMGLAASNAARDRFTLDAESATLARLYRDAIAR